MADAHEEKAGNRGDVWKHFVLAAVVDVLLSRKSKGQAFSYVDTHCSFGCFSLSAGRQWKEGIGLFHNRHWRLASHPYFALECSANDRESYLGSWMIVKELVRSHGLKDELILFDTCGSVAKSLKDEPGFSQSSGFEACFATPNRPDLILCDPAYSDEPEPTWKKAEDIARKFIELRQTALLWYPIYERKEKRALRNAPALMAEITGLAPATAAIQTMRGCGVMAFGGAESIVNELADQLREVAHVLGGQFAFERGDAPPETETGRPRLEPKAGPGSRSKAPTVQPGYENRNAQTVVRATEKRGTDYGQYIYVLRCRHCEHEYGANGSDTHIRKCPSCQGGVPGLLF